MLNDNMKHMIFVLFTDVITNGIDNYVDHLKDCMTIIIDDILNNPSDKINKLYQSIFNICSIYNVNDEDFQLLRLRLGYEIVARTERYVTNTNNNFSSLFFDRFLNNKESDSFENSTPI